ncbi:hypothetical protein [Paraburkholderia sp. SG-MS1]|uniref:hypothetical protein n=1 Tax=Paraburkholderia sp. SG-MS1 TaxID=2023741 RepID=UPI001446CA03|nr:hypothetical protein [Paraburkholderia sp. SG-MS1]
MKPTILDSGAAGSTGSVAAKSLPVKGLRVRALVHERDERPEKLKAPGIEIVVSVAEFVERNRDAFK